MIKDTATFSYNPDTGIVTRSGSPVKGHNGPICALTNLGYLRTSFHGKNVFVHRLAWYLHYGVWPMGEIDHINGNRTDNRIANLRESTRSQQTQNKIYPVGPSGYRGVKYHAKSGRWNARITHMGKTQSLGLHDTPRDAFISYALQALELYGTHARLS